MSETLEIRLAEGLVVGPDEVLIVLVRQKPVPGDAHITKRLQGLLGTNRVMVLFGAENVELAKVKARSARRLQRRGKKP